MKSQIATARAYSARRDRADRPRVGRDAGDVDAARADRQRASSPEGTPLVQRDLAQRLGVSQTPVRIGLSELEREGLVEVGDTGRALVSRLTREGLEEIYAARLGLEGLAARVGAVAVDDAGVAEMRVLLRELDRLAKGARRRRLPPRALGLPRDLLPRLRADCGSSPRSSASTGAPSATTTSSSRRPRASAARSPTTASSSPPARRATATAAERGDPRERARRRRPALAVAALRSSELG